MSSLFMLLVHFVAYLIFDVVDKTEFYTHPSWFVGLHGGVWNDSVEQHPSNLK